MPVACVVKAELERLLGIQRTDDEFSQVLADMGLELDEVVMKPERSIEGSMTMEPVKHYNIDVTANRSDVLCVEGLAVALRPFLGLGRPCQRLTSPSHLQVYVDCARVGLVRPYLVSAVVRHVHFTQTSYNSFIDYQEKLHQNLGRRRTLVAIGAHDLKKLDPTHITYTAEPPEQISFRALNQAEKLDGRSLFAVLGSDQRLKEYLPLLQGHVHWPVIRDGRGEVLSLPPIINSEYSKIDLSTTDVFIECTAMDLTRAQAALCVLTNALVMHTSKQTDIETVTVIYDGYNESPHHDALRTGQLITPSSLNAAIDIPCSRFCDVAGIPRDILSPAEICKFLERVGIDATPLSSIAASGRNDSVLRCRAPFYRPDIIGEPDIVEQFCISFGFNNIAKYARLPPSATIGNTLPGFQLAELVRGELVACGYTELALFSLCALEDAAFGALHVELQNSRTAQFTHGRGSLVPGLLQTASEHQTRQLPIRVFEVGEVLVPISEENDDVGVRARRRIACLQGGPRDDFSSVHGVVDRLARRMGVSARLEGEDEEGTCLSGRRAAIYFGEKKVGWLGVIAPSVLAAYGVPFPCTAMELNLDE
ncbi:Phenylalanyl-tRNA synthetase beta chain [Giardia muris]|uniref:phenylalanine--tRNA ligase n=1 Tax=Giardia muris TaxID=5742 RepID=A0A4Z1T3R2_GIAMU|nr:Phenylalanyl-tRNA synthetase beta chain [Giardia muris]|eukprot:TNJ27031.1 Phenylalanyl-tRNA synthetase beta chain [Giardia muris]